MTMIVGPQNYMIGKGVVSALTGYSLINMWQPLTTYAIGDAVINFDPAAVAPVLPIKVYHCTTGGASASSGGPTGTTSSITDGTVTWAYVAPSDVGNVEDFQVNLKPEIEDHYTSRTGAVVEDFSAMTKLGGGFSVKMTEFTMENLALVNYGVITGTAPNRLAKMGNQGRKNMLWQFVGAGTYGNHYQVILPRAQINPPDNVGYISEKIATFDCKGNIYAMPSDNYAFYYVAEIA
jgi:hypothetical protein